MTELRQASIDRTLDELDRTIFTRHAFDCSFNEKDGPIVKIMFKERPEFRFVIEKNEQSYWITKECPGFELVGEEKSSPESDFRRCKSRLGNWVQRVFEEYRVQNTDVLTVITEMKAKIDQTADQIEEPLSPFSDAEAALWKKKLDSMYRKIEQMSKEAEIHKKELQNLKNDIERLKECSSTMPRSTWMKAAGYTFLKVLNSKVGQVIAERALSGLLTGGSGSEGRE